MSDLEIHPAIKQHLQRQGLSNDYEFTNFLYPKLSDLPSPFLMKDMDKAAELVLEVINKKSEIIIWGDYDVDGITSTALLILFFKEIGLNVKHHIPDRLTEGYGLNINKLENIFTSSNNDKLLITVDCGISNHEEVAFAKELGFKVIITDHHTPPEKAVQADAILNPNQKECDFPFKHLAGVGVAFYLAASIRSKIKATNDTISVCNIPNMKLFMGFVSLGTIADVMPLIGVNRILVKGGFETLSSEKCPNGLKNLFDSTGVDRKVISSEAISFQLAPTVNAAGRLGEPLTALKALISESSLDCSGFSEKLVSLNKKRKKISSNDLEYALTISNNSLLKRQYSIIIEGDFNDGILGITASRLVEIYNLPVIVLCKDAKNEYLLKGSARGPKGFDLYKTILSCSRFLNKFGGHKVAAGLSLNIENLDLFREAFENISSLESGNIRSRSLDSTKDYLDLSVSEALNPVLTRNICQLEPMGESNPKPIFIDRNSLFVKKSFFGQNREHLRGVLRGKYKNVPVIGFSLGDKAANLENEKPCTLAYSHMYDNFNNSNSWKLRIHDIWQMSQV